MGPEIEREAVDVNPLQVSSNWFVRRRPGIRSVSSTMPIACALTSRPVHGSLLYHTAAAKTALT
ncbi:MAG: hypothetical protein FWD12_04370 [Alphaproteobacteria bacterium]|nr:hypothetical protein [Alphaproteobacteria bacterium]